MAKGKSSIQQKKEYQQKQTYQPNEKMQYVPCKCDRRGTPPGWLLDKIAEEKLTGKFNVRKDNLCTTCYQFKSRNGSCGCS